MRSFSGKTVLVFQGALAGGLTSLLFVSWLVIGAQAEIARGAIKFEWKPMSTEGCTGNLSDPISALSAANNRYCRHCYSHTVVLWCEHRIQSDRWLVTNVSAEYTASIFTMEIYMKR